MVTTVVAAAVTWVWYMIMTQRAMPGFSQLRATTLTMITGAIASSVGYGVAVVLGYGDVGKGCAQSMRGFGAPQVCFAYESQMDEIAAALGIDPLEIRLRNVFGNGSLSPTGQVLESVVIRESLLQAARRFGWTEGGA